MTAKKVVTTVYLSKQQKKLLRALSVSTGVSVAEYVRRGIDMALQQAEWEPDIGKWANGE